MNEPPPRRHKGLGIASFIIALSVLVVTVLLFLVAGVMHNAGASSPTASAVIGSAIFFLWFLDLVAVGLGIAGAVDSGSKKGVSGPWHRHWLDHGGAQRHSHRHRLAYGRQSRLSLTGSRKRGRPRARHPSRFYVFAI